MQRYANDFVKGGKVAIFCLFARFSCYFPENPAEQGSVNGVLQDLHCRSGRANPFRMRPPGNGGLNMMRLRWVVRWMIKTTWDVGKTTSDIGKNISDIIQTTSDLFLPVASA